MIYEKLPVLLLSAIAVEKNDSINSGIARAILAHPDYIQTLGIKDMAAYCHVGTSTLSRFCKAIGLEDFYELRALIQSTDFTPEINANDISTHVNQVKFALDYTVESVDTHCLDQLCIQLHKSRNTAAFGLLKAMSAAISFQTDMNLQGKPVYTNLSFTEQMTYLKEAGPDDLILLFSYTGSYFDALTEHLNLNSLLSNIWIICGKEPNTLPDNAHILKFQSDSSLDGHPYQLLMAADMIVRRYAKLFPEH